MVEHQGRNSSFKELGMSERLQTRFKKPSMRGVTSRWRELVILRGSPQGDVDVARDEPWMRLTSGDSLILATSPVNQLSLIGRETARHMHSIVHFVHWYVTLKHHWELEEPRADFTFKALPSGVSAPGPCPHADAISPLGIGYMPGGGIIMGIGGYGRPIIPGIAPPPG